MNRFHLFLFFLVYTSTGFSQSEKDPKVPVQPLTIGVNYGVLEKDTVDDESKVPGSSPKAALEIIFDCSNSMNAKMNGTPKIDLAKKALARITDSLEEAPLKVGLRVFGHDRSIDREDLPRACVNSELVVPIAENSVAAIRQQIPGLTAWGRTPIAYSLEKAADDLGPYLEDSPMILLVSDGLESCDGDPLKTIANLQDIGVDVQTYVIGFDLSEEERKVLEQIALLGKGRYYNASNYDELVGSFDQFLEDASQPKARELNPVTGGKDYASATVLEPGRYTFSQHLRGEGAVFFRVPTSKGQRVVINTIFQAPGLVPKTGEEGEHAEGTAAVHLYKTEDGRPDKFLIRGEVGEWFKHHALDVSGNGIVFSYGDDHVFTNKDTIFEITVQEAGDLYVGEEAPDSIKDPNPVNLPVGKALHAHLGVFDYGDVFRIDLDAIGNPETLNLKVSITPTYQWSSVHRKAGELRFRGELYNQDGNRLMPRFLSQEFAEPHRKGEVTLKTAGAKWVLLHLENTSVGGYHVVTSYTLEVTKP